MLLSKARSFLTYNTIRQTQNILSLSRAINSVQSKKSSGGKNLVMKSRIRKKRDIQRLFLTKKWLYGTKVVCQKLWDSWMKRECILPLNNFCESNPSDTLSPCGGYNEKMNQRGEEQEVKPT